MNILNILPQGKDFVYWIFTIVIFTFLGRVILTILRAFEHKTAGYKKDSFGTIFLKLFCGFVNDEKLDDYWLSALIGLTELVVFPILIFKHRWDYIGFWILIKSAGSWGKWQKSRVIYNRFLFGNIVSLFFSYLVFHQFFLRENILSSIMVFIEIVTKNPNQTGLLLNFVGTIMIALSITKCPSEAYKTDEKGRKIHLTALVHPLLFKIGIISLIFGFVLQFIATFML